MRSLVSSIPYFFLLLAVGCTPSEGDVCHDATGSCEGGDALWCIGGVMRRVHCAGPNGCRTSGFQVTCDQSRAASDDWCVGPEGGSACSADGTQFLQCIGVDGSWNLSRLDTASMEIEPLRLAGLTDAAELEVDGAFDDNDDALYVVARIRRSGWTPRAASTSGAATRTSTSTVAGSMGARSRRCRAPPCCATASPLTCSRSACPRTARSSRSRPTRSKPTSSTST